MRANIKIMLMATCLVLLMSRQVYSSGFDEIHDTTRGIPAVYVQSRVEQNDLILLQERIGQATRNEVNDALLSAARAGHQSIVAYLLSDAVPLAVRPNQEGVNWALSGAAHYGHQSVIVYLLSDAVPLAIRPNQEGVNWALSGAARAGHQDIVVYLLSDAVPEAVRPNREDVNFALRIAASAGHQGVVEYLLSDAVSLAIRPSREGVNKALHSAAGKGHQSVIVYILSDAVPLAIRPNREGVNKALSGAAGAGQQAIVEYLLSDAVPEAVRPNQEGVNNAYYSTADANIKQLLEHDSRYIPRNLPRTLAPTLAPIHPLNPSVPLHEDLLALAPPTLPFRDFIIEVTGISEYHEGGRTWLIENGDQLGALLQGKILQDYSNGMISPYDIEQRDGQVVVTYKIQMPNASGVVTHFDLKLSRTLG